MLMISFFLSYVNYLIYSLYRFNPHQSSERFAFELCNDLILYLLSRLKNTKSIDKNWRKSIVINCNVFNRFQCSGMHKTCLKSSFFQLKHIINDRFLLSMQFINDIPGFCILFSKHIRQYL